jgi:proline iminopeptidase
MPPVPSPRSSGFTTSTSVPLYWVAYGPAGGERLLVLHGGPGAHHDYLLPQMLRLAEHREVVLYDQRGGGRSRTDDRAPITWRTNVDDLALVVRELELDPLTLVGYSWGGLLALLYAVESERSGGMMLQPERLVLIDPAPANRVHRERFEAELARRQNGDELRGMRAELAHSGLRERDPEAYRQRLFELSVAGYFADPSRARDLTPFRVTGRVQQSVWESLGPYDLRPDLARVQAPTLILHGRQDPIPLESSQSTASALPDARLVVIESSGHVPYVEAPEDLFNSVESFLNERSTA